MPAAVAEHRDPRAPQRVRAHQRLHQVDELVGRPHDVRPGGTGGGRHHGRVADSAPVWERAARALASMRPTVRSTTGLPAPAAASTKARPSRKSSA